MDARDFEVFIMVSIISRTEEDQIKIINKDVNNKFKWSWLEKTVTVQIGKEMHKFHWQTVLGRSMCVGRLSVVDKYVLTVLWCEHISKTLSNKV